jgi:predicted metal-dependent HD superfamily phosphohydrolase
MAILKKAYINEFKRFKEGYHSGKYKRCCQDNMEMMYQTCLQSIVLYYKASSRHFHNLCSVFCVVLV